MKNIFDISDRVVVITGGSGLLGTQFVASLQDAGAVVENFDLNTGVDITDESSIQKAVEGVMQRHGRIDGLVTAAATNPKTEGSSQASWTPYTDFSEKAFRKEIDVNLVGSFLSAKMVSKYMVEARKGSIVFISSHYALVGPTNALYSEGRFKSIAYGASKAGIIGLTRFFAAYLGPYSIRVNALVPGGMFNNHEKKFATDYGALTMLGRMANPGEYDGTVQFLLSDASTYMTGASIVIDGGITAR